MESPVTDTEEQLLILQELVHMQSTVQDITRRLHSLNTLTAPQGPLRRSQQRALDALQDTWCGGRGTGPAEGGSE